MLTNQRVFTTSRLICAAVFFIEQNYYFGWNTLPQSPAELIADGIAMLLLALAFNPKVQS